MKNLIEIKAEIKKDGSSDLGSGISLLTQEQIISEQKDWDDSDGSKRADFTRYPLWVTTDDGQDPEGFHDIEDVLEKYFK